ncbi:anoctamin-3 isoform X3 [Hydra vulgaris]|uniref:Anoctamin n=1 Tax=Hydra vulgaris TaxID=6087 RepID=A0ABM4D0R7_HYDVU
MEINDIGCVKKTQLPPLKNTVDFYKKSKALTKDLAHSPESNLLHENILPMTDKSFVEKSSVIKDFYKELKPINNKADNQNNNVMKNSKDLFNIGITNSVYQKCESSNDNDETPIGSELVSPNRETAEFEFLFLNSKENKNTLNKINSDNIYSKVKAHKKKNKHRKICDFILVHNVLDDNIENNLQRKSFVNQMKSDGLEISEKVIGELVFTEIHAPFNRLCKEAELVSLHMPLEGANEEHNLHSSILNRCFFHLKTEFVVDMISAAFNNSNRNIFYGIKNKKTFFRTAYRSMLVQSIINRYTFCADKSEESIEIKGLNGLIHHEVYNDAFILHERSEYDSKFPPPIRKNLLDDISNKDSRKELNDTWLKFYKFQPLWKIRDYYGEKIAFYFAWLGVLITSLWIPALLGIAVFLYGIITLCLKSKQNLNLKYFQVLLPQALDNEATPYFAVIICLWGTIFLEFWKQKNAELAYKWDVDTYEEEEVNRPQFRGTKVARDPFTGKLESYYPKWKRVLKSMGSLAVISFMILLVVASIIAIVVYKVASKKWFSKLGSGMSSFTSSVLNTISILLLGTLYKSIAYKLTDWENHQTSSEYEDSLILKLFGFQFINSYASLYYIAFFREMTQSNGVFNMGSDYTDGCGDNGNCMSPLSMQVAVLLIAKPMPKFFSDIIKPILLKKWNKLKPYCFCSRTNQVLSETNLSGDNTDKTDDDIFIEDEYNKPQLDEFPLSEYTEKVLQYGYLMLFASALPLAPLIAMVTTLIDLRIDARRLLWFNRRPVPERAEDIGMWFTILSFLNFVGIITNALIIGLISNYSVKYKTYKHLIPLNSTLLIGFNSTTSHNETMSSTVNVSFTVRSFQNLWIVIVFENVALVIQILAAYFISDEPESIKRAKKAELKHMESILSHNGLKSGPGKSIRAN